ncbi:MAG TPA: Holliday junction branch migration protein RuvA [Stellaceae bacterium]
MIAALRGTLDRTAGTDGTVVVDVGGVGYLVFCSARTARQLPGAGEAVKLVVETHVREDHIHLYGFIDEVERGWFRLLTTVQGVGAKLALAILGALPPDTLLQAILAQDKAALAQAEGVGPRLAARIANELREKVAGLSLSAGTATVNGVPTTAVAASAPVETGLPAGAGADAVSALVNLGYRRLEAMQAVGAASRQLGDAATLDGLIRAGLKELAR